MNRIVGWLHERIPIRFDLLREPLREPLPVHLKQWACCLGGTPLILFCIQACTGILLMFYYVPSPVQAYDSVMAITYHVRLGWFIRGIHRTAAHLMIFTLLLHMIRVFGTRAYRKPRELNWMLGVASFLTVLGFGFTGYSLVYDQLSYWATTVGTNLLGDAPVVGKALLYLLRGGPDVNPNTLTRLYILHIALLPMALTLLIVAHILLVRMHGVARLESDPRPDTYPFFPDHVLRECVIAMLLLTVLVNYVIFFPPDVGVRADPLHTPADIRPEWYFFPAYRWLKIVPLQVGLWGSFFYVACLFLWPFIDAALERMAPRRHLGLFVGTCGFLITIVFLVWEAVAGAQGGL